MLERVTRVYIVHEFNIYTLCDWFWARRFVCVVAWRRSDRATAAGSGDLDGGNDEEREEGATTNNNHNNHYPALLSLSSTYSLVLRPKRITSRSSSSTYRPASTLSPLTNVPLTVSRSTM